MKSPVSTPFAAILAAAVAFASFAVTLNAQEFDRGHDFGYEPSEFHGFVPGSIVLSGTVYVGNANTVTPGEVLPLGCLNTGSSHEPQPRHRECAAATAVHRDHGRDGDLRLCQR